MTHTILSIISILLIPLNCLLWYRLGKRKGAQAYKKLLDKFETTPLPPEYAKVVEERFWKII
jgi:hypothetical protein